MAKLVVVFAIAFLIIGGQGIYTALQSGKQLTMSCDDYIKQKPKDKWVKLTGCEYTAIDGLIHEKRGSDEVMLPVWGVNQKEDELSHIVLTSDDSDFVAAFKELGDAETEEQATAAIKKNENMFFYKGDIEGLVEFGIDRSSREKGKVEQVSEGIDKDAVYIAKGKRPNASGSLIYLFLGVALPVGYIAYGRWRTKKDTNELVDLHASLTAQGVADGSQPTAAVTVQDADKAFERKDTPPTV